MARIKRDASCCRATCRDDNVRTRNLRLAEVEGKCVDPVREVEELGESTLISYHCVLRAFNLRDHDRRHAEKGGPVLIDDLGANRSGGCRFRDGNESKNDCQHPHPKLTSSGCISFASSE